MTVTWAPIRSDWPCLYAQPATDVLSVNGSELDFTDATIVEFDIPEQYRDYVQRAWRENGELRLRLLAHYGSANALRDEVTRRYEVGALIW